MEDQQADAKQTQSAAVEFSSLPAPDREIILQELQATKLKLRSCEEQLRQSQKMESVGHLAGGIAHDFKNILTIIHGHASLLSASSNLDEEEIDSVQQIVQATRRASDLTKQLLTFVRRQIFQPKDLDLNEIVLNMSDMLRHILGEDILLEVQPDSAVCKIRADAGMMEQILLNLAVNARDAMPKGGRLSISTSQLSLEPDELPDHGEAFPGNYVRLTVTDTGSGIASEDLPRIFEPFFTTKAPGKGTGLGLATVFGIVKQHQGWIDVRSKLQQGTSFHIYLPVSWHE